MEYGKLLHLGLLIFQDHMEKYGYITLFLNVQDIMDI